MPEKALYYGDNLEVLRQHIPDASVDLIYLDPPFNSARDYNVLFKQATRDENQGQITAFTDTWQWSKARYDEFFDNVANARLFDLMSSLHKILGNSEMMAYLVMMAPRLLQLHRVLKPTGSLYLHCDPTASHYLRIILDALFGPTNFRNEAIWKRTSAHANVGKRYAMVQDRLLFYTKSQSWVWNQQHLPYTEDYIDSHYSQVDSITGRRFTTRDLTASMQRASRGQLYEWKGIRPPSSRCWAYTIDRMAEFEKEGRLVYSQSGMPRLRLFLDEMPGVPCDDIWLDISPINSQAAERLGYPTQKTVILT